MAPNPNEANQLVGSYTKSEQNDHIPHRLSTDGLQRTVSDVTFELNKEDIEHACVENAKCECCGMSEECTPDYINRVRDKFSGNLICGLCAAAVNEEKEKNGGKGEEALEEHMSACVKFNRLGRSYPVLYQAEAIKQLLKKSPPKKGGIVRSSSCIPAMNRNNKV